MTSPLVRTWLAARLPDWVDHVYACWRGTLHAFGVATEWDPCEIDACYLDLPGPARSRPTVSDPEGAVGVNAPSRVGELHFHTLMPCPVCHVSVGKDCVTRFGNVTRPHRARRDAAARQTAAES